MPVKKSDRFATSFAFAFFERKATNMDSGQLTNPLCACEWGFRPRRMKGKIQSPLNLSLSY